MEVTCSSEVLVDFKVHGIISQQVEELFSVVKAVRLLTGKETMFGLDTELWHT
jgi:hypothetical protein